MGGLLVRILTFLERLFPRLANRIKIGFLVRKEKRQRPHPYSLWTGPAPATPPPPPPFVPSDYVSWPGLADRGYTGRHLPPDPNWDGRLPKAEELFEQLFLRRGEMRPCKQTTTLFCFFAQWFTDSFLRTDRSDHRRHTGNNEIDYCQIYGLDEVTAAVLRTRQGGRMRMRTREGGDLLPLLVAPDESDRGLIDPDFRGLPYLPKGKTPVEISESYRAGLGQLVGQTRLEQSRWENLYATGLDRGNSTIFYTAISTMCLREHNRLAGELAALHPEWDDNRLFETARLVNIHNVLQIVIEDYINHIAGNGGFKLDTGFAEREPWYRTNRISIEFNLLYRWHSLVPDRVPFDGRELTPADYRFNNVILEQSSPEALINAASAARAGRIGVRNTPEFLRPAELASINLSREFRLQPFNAYCERFGHPKYESIEALAKDEQTAATLRELYRGDVNKVEFLAGLYAEGRSPGSPDSVLPPLLRTMVAVDAFTHIFTNPVLSGQVREAAFPEEVAALTTGTGGIKGLMARNSAGPVKAVPRFALP
ncbi:MAG TPA: peroxidase family protein [Allosphingosinicella sp.]|jgi:prostaglandin-endoperoxide synthase 2